MSDPKGPEPVEGSRDPLPPKPDGPWMPPPSEPPDAPAPPLLDDESALDLPFPEPPYADVEPAALSLETPTIPLPSPLEPATPPVPLAPPVPPAHLHAAIGTGFRHAWRCRRALVMIVVAQMLLAATVAGPVHSRLSARLSTHAHAPALGGHADAIDAAAGWGEGLDWSVLSDLRRKEAPFLDAVALALVWVALAAWVFGALAASGFLDTADAPPARRRVTCARFLEGGGRWFWRCLRVGLCFAVAYAILGRLVFEAWPTATGKMEREATSQAVGWRAARYREATFVLGFLLLRVVADVARARMVAFRRRSAVLSFLRSFPTVLRHPIRTTGSALVFGLLEVGLLLGAAGLLEGVPGGSAFEVVVAFLVFQAAVLVRWASRGALLASYVHLHHAHAGTPFREDPPAPVTPSLPAPSPSLAAATVG